MLGGLSHQLFFLNSKRLYIVSYCSKLVVSTLKKSYKRPPHIFSSSSESKLRSIKIYDQINKPMSNSGSESVCIPKCVICLTQSKHE